MFHKQGSVSKLNVDHRHLPITEPLFHVRARVMRGRLTWSSKTSWTASNSFSNLQTGHQLAWWCSDGNWAIRMGNSRLPGIMFPAAVPTTPDRGSFGLFTASHRVQWHAGGMRYLAENSSKVSSSWAPERRLHVVLKLLARLTARAAGTCTRDRGNWEALKTPEGRTARVARRKIEVDDIVRCRARRASELAC